MSQDGDGGVCEGASLDRINPLPAALFLLNFLPLDVVLSHNDCQLLQNDINNLYDYGIRWGLKFSFDKCTMLSVTRKKVPINFTYTINNKPVRRVQSMKDLGVAVTSDLSWNSYINTLVSKCNRMMGMIKRSLGYKAPINVTSYLYSTLVRSNLEHCSTVWSPFNFNEMQALEFIQRAATRYILQYPDVEYSERCTTLNLLPLSFRRDCADLIFFFKYSHGLYAVQLEDFFRQKFTRQIRAGAHNFY